MKVEKELEANMELQPSWKVTTTVSPTPQAEAVANSGRLPEIVCTSVQDQAFAGGCLGELVALEPHISTAADRKIAPISNSSVEVRLHSQRM